MGTMLNSHLTSVSESEIRTTPFEISFDNWVPLSGSDDIKDGNYALKVDDMVHVEKKGGGGRNVKLTMHVDAPECSEKGKKLVVTHPLQVGDSSSEDNRKKGFMPAFLYSMASGSGIEAAEKLRATGGVIKRTPEFYKGKVCYAHVERELNTSDRWVGVVRRYITKDDFLLAPGPSEARDSVPATAPATATAPQQQASATTQQQEQAQAASDPMADLVL